MISFDQDLLRDFSSASSREWLETNGIGGFSSSEACLNQVSEIFDGDAPHAPRGCVAQAWSVSELLRAAVEAGDASFASAASA
jgi:hypothetical protein